MPCFRILEYSVGRRRPSSAAAACLFQRVLSSAFKIDARSISSSEPDGTSEGAMVGAAPTIAPSEVPSGSLEEIERASILKALESTRWNKQAAAALLGLRRPTLYSKMRKHGIPQRPG